MSEIKLETLKSESTETYISGHGVHVTVNGWSNYEGANVMMHSQADGGLALRAAFAGRWEELDVLIMAMTAARSAG